MGKQVMQGGIIRGLELQVAVLDIPYQQDLVLQVSFNPLTDHLDSRGNTWGPDDGRW